MEQRDFQYEDQIKKLLDELVTKIGEVEAIEDYKKIAQKVDKHQGLKFFFFKQKTAYEIVM